jgi:hypothetical protein
MFATNVTMASRRPIAAMANPTARRDDPFDVSSPTLGRVNDSILVVMVPPHGTRM